jgi:hypothetical protein
MSLKVWIIELKVDFATQDQADAMLEDVRRHAKELLAVARLLADKRKPDVGIHYDDMYEGRDKIDMFTPEERDEYGL